MLKVVKLTKDFDKVRAVNNFSFEIGEGEVVGLVGPNGCGKTTTINCITSLLNSTSGEIFIQGHDLYKVPEKAKAKIAYVPEMPILLFEDLSVLENIQFASKAYFHDDWKDTAMRLIGDFDLEDKKNSAVRSLSKGQKQKTAIICAFVHEPELVFFDEPLIGIDPKGAKRLKELIREHKEKGGSVLISSHMLSLIEEVCDRVMIMNDGKLMVEGTFEEIKNLMNKKLLGMTEEEKKEMDYDFEDLFIKITEGESPAADETAAKDN